MPDAVRKDLSGIFERRFVTPKQGRALIVGSRLYGGREDRRQRYAEAVGLDMLAGDGVDLVHDLEEPLPARVGTFAHIECMSVLEHSRRPWLLAANLCAVLEKGGTLHLSVPFVWRVHAYPNDYWRFSMEGVRALFGDSIKWERLMYSHVKLTAKDLVPARGAAENDCPLLPRTEVLGFGVRA